MYIEIISEIISSLLLEDIIKLQSLYLHYNNILEFFRSGLLMETTKDLKKMNRQELLELLLDTVKENEALKQEVQTLEQRLNSREVLIEESGSIAEASLRLSGVFDAAQKAADIYLFNIEKANKRNEQIIQNTKTDKSEAPSENEIDELLRQIKEKKKSDEAYD